MELKGTDGNRVRQSLGKLHLFERTGAKGPLRSKMSPGANVIKLFTA
jgi:hypothetical protein